MAEIERKAQKVFAGGVSPSGNIAVYGSKLAGTVNYSSDIDAIQNERWLTGLFGAISPDKAPYVQDLNAIFYVLSKQLAYIFQAGIPEWNSQTEYFAAKSVVRYNGQLYISVANSTNKAPTDNSYWMKLDNNEFNQSYSTAIGGYKSGTILNFNGYKIRSLVDNNNNTPTVSNIKVSDYESGTFYWELADSIAPGTIMPYAGKVIPSGWGLCNGQAVSRANYSFLFRLIGTTYGQGNGSTTFNLPDFRNKTFWGGDTGNSGTVKEAGLPNITGDFNAVWEAEDGRRVSGAFGFTTTSGANEANGSPGNTRTLWNIDASRSNAIYGKSDTVQPPAIQVPFIIKY